MEIADGAAGEPAELSLTTDQLAAAALAVVDRSGLAGLSMRTVGGELGMSTMGLYRYVADRDELERLVVDRVFDAVDVRPPAEGPWERQVEDLVGRVRNAFAEHPAVVALTLVHRHRSPGALRWAETLLAVLSDAGFTDRERLIALRALFSYLVGALQLEHLGPLAGAGTRELAGLPPDEFPHTTANARYAQGVTADEEFTEGLRMLLRGLSPTPRDP
ncbi:TetR/AcrR family transcriptional regulator [Cryptosporangium phraense]|uniref:TetR/AcrR family transcriptional regulator n=1 Tax=Cryptosporangium phraense TaxID=2593070 RepID=A0A545AY43_9ACTN|nr:TetR/AcrR family transcriptional regulator C-terminal domain-containing protein [Cryptosporangium phraense]TQS46238.1 TetR/AcrR family transcriptional regulator [Cryptosporangium phraense]